jgi:hypothetical protein
MKEVDKGVIGFDLLSTRERQKRNKASVFCLIIGKLIFCPPPLLFRFFCPLNAFVCLHLSEKLLLAIGESIQMNRLGISSKRIYRYRAFKAAYAFDISERPNGKRRCGTIDFLLNLLKKSCRRPPIAHKPRGIDDTWPIAKNPTAINKRND